MFKWKCFNCKKESNFPEKYDSGKGLEKKEKIIEIKCTLCNSLHRCVARYKQGEKNNVELFLYTYEISSIDKKFTIYSIEEKDISNNDCIAIIQKDYLNYSFDNKPKLKKILEKIESQIDKDIFTKMWDIIGETRNKIIAHNDKKIEKNSKLDLHELIILNSTLINTMISLSIKYGANMLDINSNSIAERKIELINEK